MSLDFLQFYQTFSADAARYRFVEQQLIRIAGDPISVWFRPAVTAAAPRVYLSAGIHGDEPAGCVALQQLMAKGFFSPNIEWTIFPALNPSGLRRGTRENADGIDLNRDYLSCHTAEVKAHVHWLRQNQAPYTLTLSLHEDWESQGFYMYEIVSTTCDSIADTILSSVGKVMLIEPKGIVDGHVMDAPGLIRHEPEADEPEAWPEAIFHSSLWPVRSYTLETPSSMDLQDRATAHKAALHAAIQSLTPQPADIESQQPTSLPSRITSGF